MRHQGGILLPLNRMLVHSLPPVGLNMSVLIHTPVRIKTSVRVKTRKMSSSVSLENTAQ